MKDTETNLLPVSTLVLWTTCTAVGMAGLVIPYPRPLPAPKEPPPVQAKLINVTITNDSSPPPDIGPPEPSPDRAEAQPTPTPEVLTAPPEPPMAAVTTASPTISFALPTSGPARTVEAKQAVPIAGPTATQPNKTPPVRHLVYGKGEGTQPAPEYPREAALAHQQGTVVIRFVVGTDGRVQSAEADPPSRWPLLNQAALRAVRDTWRFRPGPVRTFEVSIEFDLKSKER